MHRAGSVATLVTAILLCAAPGVRADDAEPDFDAARAHYRKAQQAAQAGRWAEAAAEYLSAYGITADPVLHFRIADAYQHAGQCEQAIEHYERYVDEADPAEGYAELALRQVNACQDAILAAREGEPPKTEGDGDGSAPAGDEEVGDDGAEIPAAGRTVPPAAPSSEAGAPANAADLLAVPERTWHRGAAWTSTGVAIVAAATGGILAASASAREADLDRLMGARDPASGSPYGFDGPVRTRYEQLRREGENLALGSRIALGAAGAAAATAAVLFLLDPTRGAERAPAVAPASPGGGVGVSAGWTF